VGIEWAFLIACVVAFALGLAFPQWRIWIALTGFVLAGLLTIKSATADPDPDQRLPLLGVALWLLVGAVLWAVAAFLGSFVRALRDAGTKAPAS
jgi:hypothetical protein